MDKAPQIPERPTATSIKKAKSLFQSNCLESLLNFDPNLWDFVPPVPNDNSNSSTNNVHSSKLVHNHQNNIIYDLKKDSKNSFKNGNNQHHLIDLGSTISLDQNGNTNENNSLLDLLKTTTTNNALSGQTINFQLNPLYQNFNRGMNNNNNNLNNLNNNNNNNVQSDDNYANLYWSPSIFSSPNLTNTPISPCTNPLYINTFNQIEQASNQQKLIDFINNISTKNLEKSSTTVNDNVLRPTSVYNDKKINSQQIIDQFDPLIQRMKDESNSLSGVTYVNVDSKNVDTRKNDDIINNNNNNDNNVTNNDNDDIKKSISIFDQFIVEPRDSYNKEVDEFCEHLRSLYMTRIYHKSSSTNNHNSGLVYSPRIDIQRKDDSEKTQESEKLYIYNAPKPNETNDSLDSSFYFEENNDDVIIVVVRFNSLVFEKITKLKPNQTNLPEKIKVLDPDYNWFSIRFPFKFSLFDEILVKRFITMVIFNIFDDNSTTINENDFILKLNSSNEYLQSDALLSSYVYMQKCKTNNMEILLELIDQTLPDFWRPFKRCPTETEEILNDLNYKKILPNQFFIKFQSHSVIQLNILIDELNLSYATFLSALSNIDNIKDIKSLFNEILEKISQIHQFLSHIETTKLTVSIECLKDCFFNIELANNQPNCNLIKMQQLFQQAFFCVVQELIHIIQLYSNIFPVDFKLTKIPDRIQKVMTFEDDVNENDNKIITLKRRKKMDIAKLMDLFTIHIDVCTQVPDKWCHQYSDYAIIVNLFHGFKLLKSKTTKISKMQSTKKKIFKRLVFSQDLEFGLSIYQLPRETRVEFILAGSKNNFNKEVEALASTFFYLFDIDEIFLNGSHLLPWKEIEPCPLAISFEFDCDNKPFVIEEWLQNNYQVSYCMDPDVMMVLVKIAPNLDNNFDYHFPEIQFDDSLLQTKIPLVYNCCNQYKGDSLYGFHGCNTNRLPENVIKILQLSPIENLSSSERNAIWKSRHIVKEYPGSILKLMKSPSGWSCHDLPSTYRLLIELDSGCFDNVFRSRIEALQLLSMDYPDKFIRRTVIKWLKSVLVDELCDYLPQLVQSLRFETSIDSHLIWALFEFSLLSARFCHYFYWQLKSCLDDGSFGDRCKIYLNSLLILCGKGAREQFLKQDKICRQFSEISEEIKHVSKESRSVILHQKFEQINLELKTCPSSLPLSPSLFVNGLEVNQCSYFNSNSLPLKLVFNCAPPYLIEDPYSFSIINKQLYSIYDNKSLYKIIFKCGDDLRKDMLVMQVISIINRVWFRAGYNLRLIIFGVLNSSDRTGMIEMVSRASTLREIQVEHGWTGNFKHHTISSWLKRHNTNEFDYKIAIENFIHSCAGYVVITYLLGICDRHNDNIMITTSGNLFHIDFGKFFGDAQMMAGIKRDRVPFVFTADMAFVINEGGRPTKNYQFFVDLCCNCFILVRQSGDFLLSLLSMMIRSGIDYLSADTIQYFHKALMPNLSDSEAKVEFNRLIEKTLRSISTQLNFFIHNIAQSISSSGTGGPLPASEDRSTNQYLNSFPKNESPVKELTNSSMADYDDLPVQDTEKDCSFSFIKLHASESMDGQISNLEIVNYHVFTENNEKEYFYKVKVDRANYPESFVYRSFKEFLELHEKLSRKFPLGKFYQLKRSPMLNRSGRGEIASQRSRELQQFLRSLILMAPEIAHSDIVYTFFHSIIRDQDFLDDEKGNVLITTGRRRKPKIKLNIGYSNDALHVLVCHVRNLENEKVDSYVKLYLKPDPNKSTKRKTRVMSKNAHPTFMESFSYPFKYEELMQKTLEASVWESDMKGNKRLGQVEIQLFKLDLREKNEVWHELTS